MSDQLKRLQELEAQLREADEEFSQAAKPLDGLRDMSLEQRQAVAARLRKAEAHWEAVTREMSQVLQQKTTASKPGEIQ